MEQALSLLQQIVPEIMSSVSQRYMILSGLSTDTPVGRRLLAKRLQFSERTLRTQLEQLKQINLVSVHKQGILLTPKGQLVADELTKTVAKTVQLHALADQLRQKFGIAQCHVVSGNLDTDGEAVIQLLGKRLSQVLDASLPSGENILAITGGTTLARTIRHISDDIAIDRQITVAAARGGGSGSLTIQSTALSHQLATQLHGMTHALFVPENISQSVRSSLLKDPAVQDSIALLKKSNCLIYSVGNAKIMADRRGVSQEDSAYILQQGAVGEAMGVFFDKYGRVIYRLARIGLELEDLSNLPCEVLIVGGSNKATALSAYMKLAPQHTILIVDEALATMVLNEATHETKKHS